MPGCAGEAVSIGYYFLSKLAATFIPTENKFSLTGYPETKLERCWYLT